MEIAHLTLTVDEVATELRVGRTKAWALVCSGEIPSVKIGGHRRVARRDLESYVQSLPKIAAQPVTANH